MAETGAYRKQGQGAIVKKIAGPLHKRFPSARHFGLEIRDNAMDRAVPMPMPPGAHACCLDVVDAKLQIEPDHVYALQRRMGNGSDGDVVETIIRRAVMNGGSQCVLRAESSHPAHYPDITVKGLGTDKSAALYVIGLVYAVVAYIAH